MLCSMTKRVTPSSSLTRLQAAHQPLDQGRVDAGGGLVEQQHPRLGGQRHGELEQLLLAEGQLARAQPALGVEPDEPQQVLGLRRGGRRHC